MKKPAATKMLHVRVDDKVKTRATRTLEAMGLSVSEAVRLFLHRVVADQALPFDVKVPNAETRAAMAEADAIVRSQRARFKNAEQLFADLEENSRE
ncbi:MAG TPA: type II toxin-antitoxin system RelB/DinJ family antitoxin [Candidatus Obscuribacterales bacterium]